jgi:hypothetical protein
VRHGDADVAGAGHVAALDDGTGGLVDVHAAEAAVGDRAVADRRVGAQPYDDAVLDRVTNLTLVDRAARVLDHQAVPAAGHLQVEGVDRGAVGNRDAGTVPPDDLALVHAQLAAAGPYRMIVPAFEGEAAQRHLAALAAHRGLG